MCSSSFVLHRPKSNVPKRRRALGLVLFCLSYALTTCAFTGDAHYGTSIATRRLTLTTLRRRRRRRRHATTTTQVLAQPSPKHDDQLETDNPLLISQENKKITATTDNFQSGFLVLLSVPLAWGTFEPAVRYVYEVAPQIPTLVFSIAYYAVATTGLLALLIHETRFSRDEATPTTNSSRKSFWGGIELGTYLFLGNAFQVFGLRTTPSDRAAFLLQLTTIFVPFTQAVISGSLTTISPRVWIASVTALVGVAIISLDGVDSSLNSLSTGVSLSTLRLSGGDLLIVGAAVLYTFHCIRLELYAKTTPATQLALTKAVTEMSLSLVSALTLVLFSNMISQESLPDSVISSCLEAGENIKSFVIDFGETVQGGDSTGLFAAYCATTWIGLVTVAYTIYAQSYGQRYVKPETANLIYTIQPIYTAFFAWLLLGETLGPLGYGGGMVVLLAVLMVATDENKAN